MNEFNPAEHVIEGDAAQARSWIDGSSLSEEDKTGLHAFVDRFPGLTFCREDDVALDHAAEESRVELPAWYRRFRSTLAFATPSMDFRFDRFEGDRSPRGEYLHKIAYRLEPGSGDRELQQRLFGDAKMYLIGGWFASDRSNLAIDLEDDGERRIFEFAMEDFWDDDFDERPLRTSMFPVFESYGSMLAHVVEFTSGDGTEIEAEA